MPEAVCLSIHILLVDRNSRPAQARFQNMSPPPKPGPGEVLRRNIMAVSGSNFKMTVNERYTTIMTLL